MTEHIPVAKPTLTGNEKRYVHECLETTWISSIGPFIDRFENELAAVCDMPHAISCANGTVALHLALLGIGVGPGDEVLVPSLTYVASVNAVRYCGAEPVFLDSDRDHWNLDPADIEAKLTPRTKAILAVHLYGKPAPMEEIGRIASRHNLRVVEDAAEALGASYHGRPVGHWSDVTAFSFFGNKVITSGEGGMVVTADEAMARCIRQLKGQGQDFERRYWFPVVGYNYRMTNIEAALGVAQLEQLGQFLSARQEIESWYREELAGDPRVALQPVADNERAVCWLFSLVLPQLDERGRDEVMVKLRAAGIDSRPFFYPCHVLPPYQKATSSHCPRAEWLGARGLSLPTWVGLRREQVGRICSTLTTLLDELSPAES